MSASEVRTVIALGVSYFCWWPRPCGNVFRTPIAASNRARWTSTRPA